MTDSIDPDFDQMRSQSWAEMGEYGLFRVRVRVRVPTPRVRVRVRVLTSRVRVRVRVLTSRVRVRVRVQPYRDLNTSF